MKLSAPPWISDETIHPSSTVHGSFCDNLAFGFQVARLKGLPALLLSRLELYILCQALRLWSDLFAKCIPGHYFFCKAPETNWDKTRYKLKSFGSAGLLLGMSYPESNCWGRSSARGHVLQYWQCAYNLWEAHLGRKLPWAHVQG